MLIHAVRARWRDSARITRHFFAATMRFDTSREAHILRRLDAIDFKGKQVLEIGLGQGADSEQIIRRGAIWSGIDMSARIRKPGCDQAAVPRAPVCEA